MTAKQAAKIKSKKQEKIIVEFDENLSLFRDPLLPR